MSITALTTLLWDSEQSLRILIIIDDSFAELLKWNNVLIEPGHKVFSLNDADATLTNIAQQRADRIIFLLSEINEKTVKIAKNQLLASKVPACSVFTLTSPLAQVSNENRSSHEGAYGSIQDTFLPAETSVHYIPHHSVDLLAAPQVGNFPLFFL
jgi:hypothetical protein